MTAWRSAFIDGCIGVAWGMVTGWLGAGFGAGRNPPRRLGSNRIRPARRDEESLREKTPPGFSGFAESGEGRILPVPFDPTPSPRNPPA